MKIPYSKVTCLVAAVFSMNMAIAGNPHSSGSQAVFKMPAGISSTDYLPNTIVVKVKPEFRNACIGNEITLPSLREAGLKLGIVSSIKKFSWATKPEQERNAYGQPLVDLSLIYELKYAAQTDMEQAVNTLLQTGLFVYAEPHYIFQLTDYKPNDPDTSGTKNYYLEITRAYQAWSVSKGDTNVVIAIVDSGTDLDHPDLAANFAKNYADPVDGADNDNDGYIDNYIGWDLAGADYGNIQDDADAGIKGGNNNHGSHVSGDASAVTDNGTGVSGIGFKCRLMPVKCAADNDTRGAGGSGYILTGYEGIIYAAKKGADIINCSWGGGSGGGLGQDAVNYATINEGSLVVAAAGNESSQSALYPAAYENVLSVVSTTSQDKKSSFSNYGYSVDLCAPGSGIYSTIYNNQYAALDGTSMASPIAAGAAGIVKSVFPSYNGLQVGEQLRVTADNIDNLNVTTYKGKLGSGRINLYRAITIDSFPSVKSVNRVFQDNNNGAFLPNDTIKISSDFLNYLAPSTSALKVVLTSTSVKAQIINGTVNLGTIGTLQTATGFSPFVVFIKSSALENEAITFKLTYSDSTLGYKDVQYFTITVNLSSLDITVNELSTTETSIGRVGFRNSDATGGLGMVFKGQSMLYEASLMIGNSASAVSNNARSNGAADEHFVSASRVKEVENNLADFESEGEFNDNASPAPLDISVNHKAFAWSSAPDTRYVMFKHKIFNNGASDLNNLYFGYFADLDVGADNSQISQNRSGYDTVNRMGYVYFTGVNGYYAAIKVLSTDAGPNFHSMSNTSTVGTINMSDGFSTDEKFTALSSGIGPVAGTTGTGEDVMISVATGPYTITAGSYVNAAFAFIAGENLADIKLTAQAAQNKYDGIKNGIGFVNLYGFNLEESRPNPATDKTAVSFSLPRDGKAKLMLYNTLGQVVKTVFESELTAGPYTVDMDLADVESGIYFYSLEFNGMAETKKLSIAK